VQVIDFVGGISTHGGFVKKAMIPNTASNLQENVQCADFCKIYLSLIQY